MAVVEERLSADKEYFLAHKEEEEQLERGLSSGAVGAGPTNKPAFKKPTPALPSAPSTAASAPSASSSAAAAAVKPEPGQVLFTSRLSLGLTTPHLTIHLIIVWCVDVM
jgi:hypothetical protein